MPTQAAVRLSFQLGDDQNIVVRISGRSTPIVAKALGVERNSAGNIQRVFLDRTIHSPNASYAGDWSMWGAISTVIERLPS